MAYPEILRDKRKAAIPQLWDGSNWRPLKGTKDGHQQTQLVGPDGQPIGSENPLEVRVRELEEKLDAMNQLLQSGDAKMQLSGHVAELVYSDVTLEPGIWVVIDTFDPMGFSEFMIVANRSAPIGNVEVEFRYSAISGTSFSPSSYLIRERPIPVEYYGNRMVISERLPLFEGGRWRLEARNPSDIEGNLTKLGVKLFK